jgi:adenine-specific DNA-methyltransferase
MENEYANLKLISEEIFGTHNHIATISWQKRYSRENREAIGDSHEYIMVYATNLAVFKEKRNFLPLTDKQLKVYSNPDNDPRGSWQSVSLLAQGYRPNQMYEIVAPNGKKHLPPDGNCWKVVRDVFDRALADNRVFFGSDGNGVPRRKQFLSEAKGLVPWTWWPHDEVGHTDEAQKEINTILDKADGFDTPKPTRLMSKL